MTPDPYFLDLIKIKCYKINVFAKKIILSTETIQKYFFINYLIFAYMSTYDIDVLNLIKF